MTRLLALAAAFLVMAAPAAIGQQPPARSAAADRPACEASALDCARYSTAPWCELSVFTAVDDDGDSPVTEERLKNAVESRLRAARLLTADEQAPFLSVHVVTAVGRRGAASLLAVGVYKRMFDLATVAWTRAQRLPHLVAILHGPNDAAYVMDAVYAALDEFINDYLRVNEPACRRLGR